MAFLKTGDATEVTVVAPDELVVCPTCGLTFPAVEVNCPNCLLNNSDGIVPDENL